MHQNWITHTLLHYMHLCLGSYLANSIFLTWIAAYQGIRENLPMTHAHINLPCWRQSLNPWILDDSIANFRPESLILSMDSITSLFPNIPYCHLQGSDRGERSSALDDKGDSSGISISPTPPLAITGWSPPQSANIVGIVGKNPKLVSDTGVCLSWMNGFPRERLERSH